MHLPIALKTPATVLAALALASCGVNTLRLEYADLVGQKGEAVATSTRSFLDVVRTTREGANVELVAADVACGRSPAQLRDPPLLGRRAPAVGWLCRPAPNKKFAIDLDPLQDDLEPTLTAVQALADYSDALTDIVNSKPADPSKAVNDALATAEAAQSAFVAVFKLGKGPLPAASDPRVKAITDFIGFLGELQVEADKVKALRKFLAEQPEEAAPTRLIAELRSELDEWEASRASDQVIMETISGDLLNGVINRARPGKPQERREAMTAYYSRHSARLASARIYPALTGVLDAFEKADGNMRRVMREHPNLNDKERAKVAEINRTRLIRALDNLTALITAFRGV
ncbi:MAG: hypothetical protein ACJ8EB_08660 [Allosphingosinicella sp.]